MDNTFISLANPNIRNLAPYQPGKPIEELERELGINQIIKLASNENPLGPGREALAAAQESLKSSADYPDGSGYLLKDALASKLDVDTSCITLGNGSDSLFGLLAQAFLKPGGEAIISEYAFASYYIATMANHGKPIIVPANNWGHDLTAMQNAISSNTQLIFIANPNNPTGTYVTKDALTSFLENIPQSILVVLDEAYFEYVQQDDYPNGIAFQRQYPNVITTRTFSKIHGLAGLRVGYAISDPEIANILNRVRPPFNVNSPALVAAAAALDDQEHVENSLQNNLHGYQQLTAAFTEMELSYLPSVGNFITVDMGQDATATFNDLLHKGIIVRPLLPYKMPNHLRITIGTEEQNERLIGAVCNVTNGGLRKKR